jgi:hypothetical protein
MSETFLGGVGGKLADQFLVQLYTPAYVFWAGGAALYANANWGWLGTEVKQLPESNIIVLAGVWLLLVTATAAIGQRFEPFIIRLLEGYYWPLRVKQCRVRRFRQRFTNDNHRFQELAARVYDDIATAAERSEFVEVDLRLHRMSTMEADLMPTVLGNILRAAERRVDAKYGLDPRICWSRLWTVLSKESRDDLSASRAAIDIGARSFIWGALFAIWTIWAWWAGVIAIVTMITSYLWMANAAEDYGDLLESAFDTSRFALYKSLNLSLPTDSVGEPVQGRLVTQYLWRGGVPVTFTRPEPEKEQ